MTGSGRQPKRRGAVMSDRGNGNATRRTGRAGFTLVELSAVAVLCTVLASMAVPMFARAVQQACVDEAATRLRVIWTAQRLHWLKHGAYCSTIESLRADGLIDQSPDGGNGSLAFQYSIEDYSETTFTVQATPTVLHWSGSLRIDETGTLQGAVQRGEEQALTPGLR